MKKKKNFLSDWSFRSSGKNPPCSFSAAKTALHTSREQECAAEKNGMKMNRWPSFTSSHRKNGDYIHIHIRLAFLLFCSRLFISQVTLIGNRKPLVTNRKARNSPCSEKGSGDSQVLTETTGKTVHVINSVVLSFHLIIVHGSIRSDQSSEEKVGTPSL